MRDFRKIVTFASIGYLFLSPSSVDCQLESLSLEPRTNVIRIDQQFLTTPTLFDETEFHFEIQSENSSIKSWEIGSSEWFVGDKIFKMLNEENQGSLKQRLKFLEEKRLITPEEKSAILSASNEDSQATLRKIRNRICSLDFNTLRELDQMGHDYEVWFISPTDSKIGDATTFYFSWEFGLPNAIAQRTTDLKSTEITIFELKIQRELDGIEFKNRAVNDKFVVWELPGDKFFDLLLNIDRNSVFLALNFLEEEKIITKDDRIKVRFNRPYNESRQAIHDIELKVRQLPAFELDKLDDAAANAFFYFSPIYGGDWPLEAEPAP